MQYRLAMSGNYNRPNGPLTEGKQTEPCGSNRIPMVVCIRGHFHRQYSWLGCKNDYIMQINFMHMTFSKRKCKPVTSLHLKHLPIKKLYTHCYQRPVHCFINCLCKGQINFLGEWQRIGRLISKLVLYLNNGSLSVPLTVKVVKNKSEDAFGALFMSDHWIVVPFWGGVHTRVTHFDAVIRTMMYTCKFPEYQTNVCV